MVQTVNKTVNSVRAVLDAAELEAFRDELEEACARDIWGMTWNMLVAGVADRRLVAVIMGSPPEEFASIWDLGASAKGKALICRAIGGQGAVTHLAELLQFMDDLARDQVCQEIVVYGRPGWEALLTGKGYVKRATVMTREVIP